MHNRTLISLTAALLLPAHAALHAQRDETGRSIRHRRDNTVWPGASLQLLHHTVRVATIDAPDGREYCLVAAVTPDTLSCETGRTGVRVVYPRENIAFIFQEYKPFPVFKTVFVVCAGGAVIALAAVNPFAMLLLSAPLIFLAENAQTEPPNPYRLPKTRERLLYRHP